LNLQPNLQATPKQLPWRIVQTLVFLVGLSIVTALIAWPRVGLSALWNVLVPVAPALLVVAPGLWRNVCPLGSTGLWPRHMNFSARRRLSPTAQGWFALCGVGLLLLIVPLRHVLLNVNGPVTGVVLLVVGALAFMLGTRFEWKSAWCSGLCPVHPVEKLYGQRPALSVANAHCTECFRCTEVCPDSTSSMSPLVSPATPGHRIAGTLLVGGFPGYVWGWFQVPDATDITVSNIMAPYAWPLGGLALSLVLYLLLRRLVGVERSEVLGRLFAAAAVSLYYWFRLPMLIGFGAFDGNGVLIDLHASAPSWLPLVLQYSSALFFLWWLVLRTAPRRAWALRPRFAEDCAPNGRGGQCLDARSAATPT
jgi:ferredoxin